MSTSSDSIDRPLDRPNGAVDLYGRPPRPGYSRSNVARRAQLGDSFGLCFSKHALVRYIERHIDSEIVEALRAQGLDDHHILERLKVPYAADLDAFTARAERAYENCCTMTHDAMFGLTYILNVGDVPLRICGDMCVTVMPAHWRGDRANRHYQTPRTWRRRRLERLTLDAA